MVKFFSHLKIVCQLKKRGKRNPKLLGTFWAKAVSFQRGHHPLGGRPWAQCRWKKIARREADKVPRKCKRGPRRTRVKAVPRCSGYMVVQPYKSVSAPLYRGTVSTRGLRGSRFHFRGTFSAPLVVIFARCHESVSAPLCRGNVSTRVRRGSRMAPPRAFVVRGALAVGRGLGLCREVAEVCWLVCGLCCRGWCWGG